MTTKWKPLTALTLSLGLMISLSSCSTGPKMTTSQTKEPGLVWTIQDAKATAVDVMNKVAAEVPEATVIGREQPGKGTWQSCDATRHSWAGFTRIALQPGTDIDAILESIEHAWHTPEGYSSERRTASDGTPSVEISGPGDSLYLIGPERNLKHLRIAAFSPCLTLPEGMTPGDDF